MFQNCGGTNLSVNTLRQTHPVEGAVGALNKAPHLAPARVATTTTSSSSSSSSSVMSKTSLFYSLALASQHTETWLLWMVLTSPELPSSCNRSVSTLSGDNVITPKHWCQGQGFVYLVSSAVPPFVANVQGNWSTFAGKSPQQTGDECIAPIFKYHLQLWPNNSSLSMSPDCNMQQ